MIVEQRPEVPAPLPESLKSSIERARRTSAFFVALAVVALVMVLLAYNKDVFPDRPGDVLGFVGWRLGFTGLSVGMIVYALERERAHRRLTKHLLEEHGRLTELERVRADIVASVTHELKTPLTSLLGYAMMLRKRDATLKGEQRAEYLTLMEQQGQHILRLVDDLLQSSRLEAGAGKLARAPLDLARLVRDVSHELALGRSRKIDVDVSDGDLGLFGDATAMEHVITNLLDNAMKYSESDTAVHVRILEKEPHVLLTVSDEGVGIDPDELPHIFERFRQTTNARARASVGLGLYIVRNLVEAHGGRVWAESEVGRGTTMSIAFPRRRR